MPIPSRDAAPIFANRSATAGARASIALTTLMSARLPGEAKPVWVLRRPDELPIPWLHQNLFCVENFAAAHVGGYDSSCHFHSVKRRPFDLGSHAFLIELAA